MKTTGVVTGIISNLVTIQYEGHVAENEICYIDLNGVKLMAEVIKVSGKNAFAQVYESTRGLHQGDKVEFDGRPFWAPDCFPAVTMACRTTLPLWKTYS